MMKTNKTNKVSFSAAKSNLLNSLILAALVVPGMAMAADVETTEHKEGKHVVPASAHTVTSNVGLVSNYVYRGITQTVGEPALQGGFDYAHASGVYVGLWGSNVNWITGSGSAGNASLELDTYAGYKGGFAEDFSYDVGAVRYNYLGDYVPPAGYVKADTSEIYGAIGYKWITAKYSYSLGDFLTVPEAKGTSYLELNASYTLADSGVTLGAHYGKQTYKGVAADALVAGGFDPSYADYKVNVSKDFSGYVLGLAYTDTNAKADGYYTYTSTTGVKKDWGKSAVVVSLTHAM